MAPAMVERRYDGASELEDPGSLELEGRLVPLHLLSTCKSNLCLYKKSSLNQNYGAVMSHELFLGAQGKAVCRNWGFRLPIFVLDIPNECQQSSAC